MSMMFKRLGYYFKIASRQASFAVALEDGRAICIWGKVPPRFLKDCQLIVEEQGLQSGLILGLNGAQGIRLECFGEISEFQSQNFRNIWHLNL